MRREKRRVIVDDVNLSRDLRGEGDIEVRTENPLSNPVTRRRCERNRRISNSKSREKRPSAKSFR